MKAQVLLKLKTAESHQMTVRIDSQHVEDNPIESGDGRIICKKFV